MTKHTPQQTKGAAMKLVEWDESFSIHVPEIDEQHKTWLDIINTLHESLLTSSGLETLTESTLQSMLDYAHKHFAYEEQFMRDIAFPDTDEHTLLHAQFLQKIHSLDNEIERGRSC